MINKLQELINYRMSRLRLIELEAYVGTPETAGAYVEGGGPESVKSATSPKLA
jgi:hypothetical protein